MEKAVQPKGERREKGAEDAGAGGQQQKAEGGARRAKAVVTGGDEAGGGAVLGKRRLIDEARRRFRRAQISAGEHEQNEQNERTERVGSQAVFLLRKARRAGTPPPGTVCSKQYYSIFPAKSLIKS